MKDKYLKPEVELKNFDVFDVITGSGETTAPAGTGTGDNHETGWSDNF